MVFSAVVLVGAVIVGLAVGGRITHLAGVTLRRRWLVLLAALVQLAGGLAGGYAWFLVGSVALIGVFLLANRHVPGTGLVSLGLLANALVIGANGAMPVSAEASGRAGVSTQPLLGGADRRHELAGPGTRLRLLGDVIPAPLPWRPQVLSPGDVLVAAGLAQLVVAGMRRRPAVAGWPQ